MSKRVGVIEGVSEPVSECVCVSVSECSVYALTHYAYITDL